MGMMSRFLKRFCILFARDRFRSELDEEVAFHRQQAEEEYLADGMTREAARFAAKRRLGNVTRLKEQTYEVIGFRLECRLQDCRFAVRQLVRSSGFTAAVIGTLTVGIGATTSIFTLVNATLLRPLPYPHADRIVSIQDARLQGQSTAGLVSVPRFFDIRARSNSFDSIGFFYFEDATMIAGAQSPVAVKAAGANAGFWPVFGVKPLLGRVFDEREDKKNMPGVAVLSYSGWRKIFGGDPSVIGSRVMIEQESTTIIGVMPQEFNAPAGVDLWRAAQFTPGDWKWRGEGTRFTNVSARLKPGKSVQAVQSDLRRIGEQLQHEYPQTDGVWQFQMESLRDHLYGEMRPALIVLLIASGFLLLIACLNVGNLLLTSATARQREVALRRALGASEQRIQWQFFTESMLLALTGGCAGLGLTFLLVRTAATRLPVDLASREQLRCIGQWSRSPSPWRSRQAFYSGSPLPSRIGMRR
jgi:predicted permease